MTLHMSATKYQGLPATVTANYRCLPYPAGDQPIVVIAHVEPTLSVPSPLAAPPCQHATGLSPPPSAHRRPRAIQICLSEKEKRDTRAPHRQPSPVRRARVFCGELSVPNCSPSRRTTISNAAPHHSMCNALARLVHSLVPCRAAASFLSGGRSTRPKSTVPRVLPLAVVGFPL
ncbi:hypothetical protein GQ607_003348 [Colletotrichum asianum]|uniref:Uncharacterized protein n=1 Tax=Colletotrichum asianum TaxID=702518 RepID=A0A8H3WLB4_9PEZI|nr:hypothetical protein GQ607_003348 [Colletotrichum asianum]